MVEGAMDMSYQIGAELRPQLLVSDVEDGSLSFVLDAADEAVECGNRTVVGGKSMKRKEGGSPPVLTW